MRQIASCLSLEMFTNLASATVLLFSADSKVSVENADKLAMDERWFIEPLPNGKY